MGWGAEALDARTKAPPGLWAILLLGFCSGLPLNVSGLSLRQWFSETGVPIALIGATANIGIAYSLKFLIAPLIDRALPIKLGRRRGWLIAAQTAMACATFALAFANPAANPVLALALAGGVAFCSACQDISVDAWRIETYLARQNDSHSASGNADILALIFKHYH